MSKVSIRTKFIRIYGVRTCDPANTTDSDIYLIYTLLQCIDTVILLHLKEFLDMIFVKRVVDC